MEQSAGLIKHLCILKVTADKTVELLKKNEYANHTIFEESIFLIQTLNENLLQLQLEVVKTKAICKKDESLRILDNAPEEVEDYSDNDDDVSGPAAVKSLNKSSNRFERNYNKEVSNTGHQQAKPSDAIIDLTDETEEQESHDDNDAPMQTSACDNHQPTVQGSGSPRDADSLLETSQEVSRAVRLSHHHSVEAGTSQPTDKAVFQDTEKLLSGELCHSCPVCFETFTSIRDYNRHIKTHRNGGILRHRNGRLLSDEVMKGKREQREKLIKELKTYNSMVRRLQLHKQKRDERPFLCEMCAKSFKDEGALKRHKLGFHIDPVSYSCDICSATFKYRGSLKHHLRTIHSDKRPFKCDHCPIAFKYKISLKSHIRYQHPHKQERNFLCSMCAAKFNRNTALMRHIQMVHSNERPYECEVCPFKFAESWQLKKHSRKHTGERPYECKVCGDKFKYSNNLKLHIKLKHKTN